MICQFYNNNIHVCVIYIYIYIHICQLQVCLWRLRRHARLARRRLRNQGPQPEPFLLFSGFYSRFSCWICCALSCCFQWPIILNPNMPISWSLLLSFCLRFIHLYDLIKPVCFSRGEWPPDRGKSWVAAGPQLDPQGFEFVVLTSTVSPHRRRRFRDLSIDKNTKKSQVSWRRDSFAALGKVGSFSPVLIMHIYIYIYIYVYIYIYI